MRKNKTAKIRLAVGGAISSSLNSLSGQKISVQNEEFNQTPQSLFKLNLVKAFSLAEAMIVILIGTIALGMAAPMITKQLKNETLTNTQMQILQRQIDVLKANQGGVPVGAVMFFDLPRCPTGWDFVGDEYIGHYPRIVGESDDNGTGDTVEQMVHRHKHVSPFMQAINYTDNANDFRYGPFRSYDNEGGSVYGDGTYEKISLQQNGKAYTPKNTSTVFFTGINAEYDNNNWYLYTSDGMNRVEKLRTAYGGITSILTCPNKDDQKVCKDKENAYSFSGDGYNMKVINIPLLDEMPLVGNENRPNSVKWLACKKGNN